MVLNLGEFGSPLLVHAVLKLAAHGAITLTNLSKDIGLVHLAIHGVFESSLLVLPVHGFDLCTDRLLFMVLQPLSFLLHRLLQKNVSLAVLIDILHQVDSCLVLSSPLLLAGVPLLLVLLRSQFIDVPLVSSLVTLHLLVVLLELLDLSAASQSLLLLVLLDGALALQRLIEEHGVSIALHLVYLLAQLLFHSVVLDKLQVALPIQNEPLVSVNFLLLFFDSPLFAKHGLLLADELFFLLALDISRLLLPVKDSHRVFDFLLLLAGLSHLSLKFFLGIELPQLSVNLLLHHLLLNVPPLVNQLLLTLDCRSVIVKLLIFTAQSVVLSLEFHVLAALDFILALLLSFAFEHLQTLEHLLANLLRRLKIVVKFLFVDAILSCKELSKLGLSLFKVSGLTTAHVLNAVANNVLFDHFSCLRLPVGLMCQVGVSSDVVHHLCMFL